MTLSPISRAALAAAGLILTAALAAGALLLRDTSDAAATDGPAAVVYKDPNCGCCSLWVDHLEHAGFVVQTHDDVAMGELKRELGIPTELWSCHTAVIDGYVVEGHVPAADVRRLLADRPEAVGIAVPGMPIGSPGMEVGDRKDPYDVLLFTESGDTSVFASH